MLMLSQISSLPVMCQPPRSISTTAWAPSATARDISARCSAMVWVLQKGRTSPAALPCSGQIAPELNADFVRWSFGADGRVPRLAKAPRDLVLLTNAGFVLTPYLYV